MSKEKALAKFLNVDVLKISNEYGHYYEVNRRIVKQGKTPEEITKTIEDLKSILDLGIQGLISSAMTSTDKVKREKVYHDAKDSLKGLAERADRRARNMDKSPFQEVKEDVYNRLKQEHLYVENILYLLLQSEDTELATSYRKAWMGAPVDDLRRDRTVNDGEYLVLTDEEATEYEIEGLQNLFEEFMRDTPDFIKKFVDEDAYIEEYSGNRGENINGYDGTEYEQEFDGVEYFIYRNN